MSADILVVFKKNFESVHDRAMDQIQSDLEKLVQERGIRVEFTAREKVRHSDFIGRDLVIVVGGDGTLTSIAHNVGSDTPVMGVNSHPRETDPKGSYGFFMGSDPENFANDVVMALDGKAIDNDLPRLQAEIVTTSGNRIKCDPALNDLLISNTHQYQPSYYLQGIVGFDPLNSSSLKPTLHALAQRVIVGFFDQERLIQWKCLFLPFEPILL